MKIHMGMLAGLVAAVVLVAGCGSSSATGTNGGGAGSANTTVQSTNNSQLGSSVLANKKGIVGLRLFHERFGPPRALVAAGGVAANQAIRGALQEVAAKARPR